MDEVYYRNINPSQESVEFDITLTPEGDTIFIFGETNINFSLNTLGFKVKPDSKFTYKDSYWEFGGKESKEITIIPEYNSFSIDTLSLSLITNSNTGSLADKVGAEGYMLEKDWIVITDTRVPGNLTVDHIITEEGFLKLFWNNCEQYNFKSYEVQRRGEEVSLTDRNKPFFIDSSFVGGVSIYSVLNHVYWPLGETYAYGHEYVYYNTIRPDFINTSFDSIRICWDKSPFKCKYTLLDELDSVIFESLTDTSYSTSRILFGDTKKFKLCISPYFSNYLDQNTKSSERYLYSTGENYLYGRNPDFTYSYINSNIYSVTSRYLYSQYSQEGVMISYNASYLIDDSSNKVSALACPINSPKVAALNSNSLYIFQNDLLQGVIKIPYESASTDHFLFSDNDKLAIASSGKYEQIDIETKKIIVSINLTDYPDKHRWSKLSTSQDAKYFCVATENGIKIYEIENGNVKVHYSDNRNYHSVYFNPQVNNQLFLIVNGHDEIEVRDVSDFTLEKTIKIPSSMSIENIDISSEHILLTKDAELTVIDLNTNKIVFETKFNNNYRIYLFDNKIYSRSGSVFDITPYLP
jgi:hypothetical protein